MRFRFKRDITKSNENQEVDSSDYAKEIEKLVTWAKLHKYGFISV